MPLALSDPARRLIGQHLIDSVDEAGYLAGDLQSVAATRPGATMSKRVLPVLQALDPPGIFARDLTECLALQLKDRDRFDPAMRALVVNLVFRPGATCPR